MEPLGKIVGVAEVIAGKVGVLPDLPGKGWLLLGVVASVLVGVGRSAFLLQRLLAVPPDPAKRFDRGEELARAGNFEAAKAAFLVAGAVGRAAQMAARLKNLEEAASLANKAGEFGNAGQWFAALGRARDAALAYDRANRTLEAGDQWAAAGDLETALARYRLAGSVIKAEQVLIKLGRLSEIGELYASEVEHLRSLLGANPQPKQVEQVQQVGRKSGEAFRRAKNFKRASEVFLISGMPFEAARSLEDAGALERASDLYMQADRKDEAARVLVQAGRFELAADVYEEMGKLDEVPRLLELAGRVPEARVTAGRLELQRGNRRRGAELLAEGGEFLEAAQIFQDEGDFVQAGTCFEAAHNWESAAASYESGGEMGRAAPMYEKCEKPDLAGRCYEKAGLLDAALAAYKKAGKFMEAGRVAESAGLLDQAISLLQKVPAGSPSHAEAVHFLARLFWRKGLPQLAQENFEKICGKKSPTLENIEAFYDFAVFLEGAGDLNRAADLYKAVLAVDFHYKDVLARKNGLDQRVRAKTVPGEEPATSPDAAAATIAQAAPKGRGFDLKAGMILQGRYQIEKEVGRGAMGWVYGGKDLRLGRPVALKVLPPHLTGDAVQEEKFRREARLAAKLNHPNIVQFYDVGSENGAWYLVMEWVNGPDLLQVLHRKGPFPLSEVRRVGIQVADALAFAHSNQVVHRDIKSANLLVTPDRSIKVADFGLARMLTEKQLTATQALGSPLYMAPEQIQGNVFDHRVDLYALGIVLYELTTGKAPFTEGEVTYHHLHTAPKPLRQKRTEVPTELEGIVQGLLEKNPEKRTSSAAEVQVALEMLAL